MRIAFISTFHVTCGVSIYMENLSEELSKLCDLKIFAEEIIPPQIENPSLNKNSKIEYDRCWIRGSNYEQLLNKILEFKPDIVHVQFVSGLFGSIDYQLNSPFQKFITKLHEAGIKIVLTFHDVPQYFPNNQQLEQWYKNLKAKFLVLNIDMSAGLRQWYANADITLIPLGTPITKTYDMLEARKKLNLSPNNFLLTQLGFLGADKGMLEIIQALPNIKIPNLKLVFAGGFHPLTVDIHRQHVKDCIKAAIKLGIANKIIFVGKVLSEDEMDLWASASNFLILNHKLVFSHGGSASVHRILQFGKPIIASDSPKLSEFLDKVQCVKTPSDKIAETVNMLYENPELQKKISEGSIEYAKKTTFDIIAQKHMKVYEKCLI